MMPAARMPRWRAERLVLRRSGGVVLGEGVPGIGESERDESMSCGGVGKASSVMIAKVSM